MQLYCFFGMQFGENVGTRKTYESAGNAYAELKKTQK
jgi:hypothetical protein